MPADAGAGPFDGHRGRASVLAAFTSGQGYCADADYSARAWLIHKTRITKGAAVGHTAWARRAVAHPQVAAALAGGQMSESFGRTICCWTGRLPADCREAADEILLGAAAAGMELPELAALAAEILDRSRPDTPDEDRVCQPGPPGYAAPDEHLPQIRGHGAIWCCSFHRARRSATLG